ncbi:MAG: alpha/beta fold hydrolase [Halobacteriota archaeon]
MEEKKIDVDTKTKVAVYCDGIPADPHIVLVHGMPLNHHMWDEQIQDLVNNHHYYVVAPDLRGCGNSDYSPDNGIDIFPTTSPLQLQYLTPLVYTYDQWAKDLSAIVNSPVLNLRDVNLVGFSMGGAVVIKYMSNNMLDSSRVARLTLVSAAGPNLGWHMQQDFLSPIGLPTPTALRLAGICAGLCTFMQLIWLGAQSTFDVLLDLMFPDMDPNARVQGQPIGDWIKQMFNSVRRDAAVGACWEMQKDQVGLMNSVKNIKKPTKIIHGSSDPFIPVQLSQYTQKNLIPGAANVPRKPNRFVPIPYAGHGVFFEKSTELSAELAWQP